MAFKVIQTSLAPAAVGPYSQGIDAGSLVFVSGQIGLDPQTGQLAGPDFASQARQALENMRQVIRAAGLDLTHVAAVDVFLIEMERFAEFNHIYQEFFGDLKPARAVVEVGALPKSAALEIKCLLVKN